MVSYFCFFFFFQAEDGIRDLIVTGVQTCALPIYCIMAQRLVRLICNNCKRPKKHSPQELLESGIDPAKTVDFIFAEGVGCLECSGTGYHGRSAICELLDLTDHIREMIVSRRPTSEIKRAAIEEGMITLRGSGLAKVKG